MKINILKLSLILISGFLYAQDAQISDSFNPNQWNKLFVEKGISIVDESILYTTKNYIKAKVPSYNISIPMRYNALSDDMEYVNDNDELFSLHKRNGLLVEYLDGRQFLFTNYDIQGVKNEGFLEVVSSLDETIRIYKRTKIHKIEVDKNPYNDNSNVSFSKETKYLITANDKIIEVPNNVNKFEKETNYKISEFVKQNKINLKKEDDLKKLAKFLNKS